MKFRWKSIFFCFFCPKSAWDYFFCSFFLKKIDFFCHFFAEKKQQNRFFGTKPKKKMSFDKKKCFSRNFANFVGKIILGVRPLSWVEKSIFRPAFFFAIYGSQTVSSPGRSKSMNFGEFWHKITIFTHQYLSDGPLFFFKSFVCQKPKI